MAQPPRFPYTINLQESKLGKPKKPQMSTTRRGSWELQKGSKLIEASMICGGDLTPEQIDNLNHATLGEIANACEECGLEPISLTDVSRASGHNTIKIGQQIQSHLATDHNTILVAMVAARDGIISSSNHALLAASTNGALYSICFTPPTEQNAAIRIKPSGKLVLEGWTVVGTDQTVSLVIHPNDCFDKSRHVGDNGHPTGSATMHVVKVHA